MIDERVEGRPKSRLTERERAFAGHYVANANAADAARKAGYSAKGGSAKTIGSRLLHKPAIQAEISRIEAANAQHVDLLLTSGAKDGLPQPEISANLAGLDPGVAIGLSRAYQQQALVMALGMALGREPQPRVFVFRPQPSPDNPKPQPITIEKAVLEADPKVAAYCAHLMGQELTRVEEAAAKAKASEARKAGLVDGKTPLQVALEAYDRKCGKPVPADDDPQKEP